MSSMAHNGDGSQDRDQRQQDGWTSDSGEETTGNPYHLSRGTRTLLRIVAVILVVTMTALFLRGFIHS